MTEEIYDVVLQPTGVFPGNYNDWERTPPPEDDFHLGPDFWIGDLPHNTECSAVMDACEPAGFNFHPTRQYGCRYALCRKVPPSLPSDYYTWDSDATISKALFLSRLIHPTTIATSYSAKLYFRDGALKTIVPGRVGGVGTDVWIVANEWRDWLSESEAERLKTLLPQYIDDAPVRVRLARGHLAHAFHAFYLDQRTASLVSALDALLLVTRERPVAQFEARVPILASALGVSVTKKEAKTFYDERSTFVHGSKPKYTDIKAEVMERYNKFESLLRACLLRASTEPPFAAKFASDQAVCDSFGILPDKAPAP
jgi:hypothetical protein